MTHVRLSRESGFGAPAALAKARARFLAYSGVFWGYNLLSWSIHTAARCCLLLHGGILPFFVKNVNRGGDYQLSMNCCQWTIINGGLKAPKNTLETSQFLCYYKKVRVFKYPRFSRFADKEGITDQELLEVVDLLEKDLADAKLGGAR